ncbi:hypothetical protein [Mycolicibacterium mengxianglii]|uniref:hypothetical protein n=1 Tax=Mycolicibacterium mengxianglii TaxID=2736649 RepID=UPI0018D14C63|nr:hypothetical protein [Mycolicibacterium mengxianglii]
MVFAAALVVQGYFSFAIKPEPYPSVRMPNFGPAADSNGTFGVTLARAEVVSSDGTAQPISSTELMSEFRFSTARPSYDYMFMSSDTSRITPEVRAWLRKRTEELVKSHRPVELKMCWQRSTFSLYDAKITDQGPCVWKAVTL